MDLPPPSRHPTGPGAHHRHGRVAVLVAMVGVALAAAAALWWPRTTVVQVFQQPAGLTYADGSSHIAVLKRVRAPAAALGLSAVVPAADRYEIVLGRDPGGHYGHRVRLDATGVDPSGLTVEWTTDGAWLTYPSGHRLFVPAKSFLGGR